MMAVVFHRAWSPTEAEVTAGTSDASPQSRGTPRSRPWAAGREGASLRLVNDRWDVNYGGDTELPSEGAVTNVKQTAYHQGD